MQAMSIFQVENIAYFWMMMQILLQSFCKNKLLKEQKLLLGKINFRFRKKIKALS